MASDVAVGDSETPTLLVVPADVDTAATLTVHSPSGATSTVAVTAGPLEPVTGSSDQQQRWTADQPVLYDQPGRWVLSWTVAGTGEGAETLEVYVVPSPVAGGPSWWPGRSRVAAYVIHRTLARNPASIIASQDVHQMTFDSTTTPTGTQTDRLIADGAAWLSMRVSPLAAALEPAAAVVVAMWVSACIERQFPADEQSLQRADAIEKSMRLMLGELVDANNAAGSTGDYGLEIVNPVHSFPPADLRWDYSGYW